MTLKLFIFAVLSFLRQTLPKNDMMLKIFYLIFLLDAPFYMIYGKKDPDLLYILWLVAM